MKHQQVHAMELAATIVPNRGAVRRATRLPGTMRDRADAPRDIAIVDISASGFLAELPEGTTMRPGARVRVAALPFGRREAVVMRCEGRRCGFLFAQPLPPEAVSALGDHVSNVTPLFATMPQAAADERLSPRASLALIAAFATSLWAMLALAVYLAA